MLLTFFLFHARSIVCRSNKEKMVYDGVAQQQQPQQQPDSGTLPYSEEEDDVEEEEDGSGSHFSTEGLLSTTTTDNYSALEGQQQQQQQGRRGANGGHQMAEFGSGGGGGRQDQPYHYHRRPEQQQQRQKPKTSLPLVRLYEEPRNVGLRLQQQKQPQGQQNSNDPRKRLGAVPCAFKSESDLLESLHRQGRIHRTPTRQQAKTSAANAAQQQKAGYGREANFHSEWVLSRGRGEDDEYALEEEPLYSNPDEDYPRPARKTEAANRGPALFQQNVTKKSSVGGDSKVEQLQNRKRMEFGGSGSGSTSADEEAEANRRRRRIREAAEAATRQSGPLQRDISSSLHQLRRSETVDQEGMIGDDRSTRRGGPQPPGQQQLTMSKSSNNIELLGSGGPSTETLTITVRGSIRPGENNNNYYGGSAKPTKVKVGPTSPHPSHTSSTTMSSPVIEDSSRRTNSTSRQRTTSSSAASAATAEYNKGQQQRPRGKEQPRKKKSSVSSSSASNPLGNGDLLSSLQDLTRNSRLLAHSSTDLLNEMIGSEVEGTTTTTTTSTEEDPLDLVHFRRTRDFGDFQILTNSPVENGHHSKPPPPSLPPVPNVSKPHLNGRPKRNGR